MKKGKTGCLVPLIIILVFLIALIGIMVSVGSKDANNEDDITPIVENAEQFSRITKDKLKKIMGKPTNKESWTNKTSKGDFDVITWSYDKNSNHYEFIIADGQVVRLSIYSEKYWNNTGDKFSINSTKEEICKSFNIVLGKNAQLMTDNNFTYTLSPVNDKIAMFDIQDIDENTKTYGLVIITYNLNYFE